MQRGALTGISARLGSSVRLEAHSNGAIFACSGGYAISLGTFSAAAADWAQRLRKGLPLGALAPGARNTGKEIDLLVRRLAGYRLLEYRIGRPRDGADDLAVIEPQVSGYWPQMPQLDDSDTVVLSRFAYMRRRGDGMVLESPLAGALFKICDPKLAGFVASLATSQQIRQLKRHDGFPGSEFLALLVDCQILSRTGIGGRSEPDLDLWDFHDLLFHARSTEGRHANPLGGVYAHSGVIAPLPAMRPPWPGDKIDLCRFVTEERDSVPPIAKILRERHSTRIFDDQQPVTLAELSRFLDGTARVARSNRGADPNGSDPAETVRPYPSAGASYELELYLAVNLCEGLAQGFYHYDAGAHALVPIEVPAHEVKALLGQAAYAMDALAPPQVLITMAARFGRVSWKYSSIAYSLVLKDVGVLTQTFYLMAAGMELGGCAVGIVNIDQFAKMTGIGCHIEGPVGQFAFGRGRGIEAAH